jgi:hypothetical protein
MITLSPEPSARSTSRSLAASQLQTKTEGQVLSGPDITVTFRQTGRFPPFQDRPGVPLDLPDKFSLLLSTKARYKGCWSGRGSGKNREL